MVTTEHVCQCQSSWNGKKSSPFSVVFSAQVQRGQSFILRSLCCVCICRNSLDPISPSTELLVPVVIHVPPLWFVFLLCSTAHHAVAAPSLDPQNRGRSNSFLPSGVLNWLLNFLKISLQITSFFLVLPSVHHHQLPKLLVPSTQVSSTKPVCWIFQFVTQKRLFWAVCWKIPNTVVQIIPSRLIGTPHPFMVSKSYLGNLVHYFVFQGCYFVIPELWISWLTMDPHLAFKNLSSIISSCLFLLLFSLKSIAWQEGSQISEVCKLVYKLC